jgi:hypothetical protein
MSSDPTSRKELAALLRRVQAALDDPFSLSTQETKELVEDCEVVAGLLEIDKNTVDEVLKEAGRNIRYKVPIDPDGFDSRQMIILCKYEGCGNTPVRDGYCRYHQ